MPCSGEFWAVFPVSGPARGSGRLLSSPDRSAPHGSGPLTL